MTLTEFVDNYSAGWCKPYASRYSTLVSGYNTLALDDSKSSTPSHPSLIAFIAVDDKIVIVSENLSNTQIFKDFLKTIEI